MRGLLWSTWEDLGLLTSAFVLSWRLWLYLSPRTRPTQRHSVSRGVWTDVSRGNSWPLTLGSYRGVCTSTCVHVRCVFIMFSVCIWAKKHSWDRWGCFLFPLRLLVSPQFSSQSEVLWVAGPACQLHTSHRWTPRWPPAVGSVPLSHLCTIIPPPSLSLSHAPVSLPLELSVGISSPSTHPCVYAPAVLQRKFIN